MRDAANGRQGGDESGRRTLVEFEFEGEPVVGREGQMLLGSLWAHGVRVLHVSARRKEPRGAFCGMGVCFDCVAVVDGVHNIRTCMVRIRPGMMIRRQQDGIGPGPRHFDEI